MEWLLTVLNRHQFSSHIPAVFGNAPRSQQVTFESTFRREPYHAFDAWCENS